MTISECGWSLFETINLEEDVENQASLLDVYIEYSNFMSSEIMKARVSKDLETETNFNANKDKLKLNISNEGKNNIIPDFTYCLTQMSLSRSSIFHYNLIFFINEYTNNVWFKNIPDIKCLILEVKLLIIKLSNWQIFSNLPPNLIQSAQKLQIELHEYERLSQEKGLWTQHSQFLLDVLLENIQLKNTRTN